MPEIKIIHRFTNNTLYACGAENLKEAVEKAVSSGASLVGARLDGASLDGARLVGARLDGARLDGKIIFIAPISISNLYWPVLITAKYMRIGCQRYKHDQWATFDDEEINRMHHQASNFWELWKTPLLSMCATYKSLAEQIKGE